MRVRTLFTKGDIERCNDCQICRLHIDWLEFRNIGKLENAQFYPLLKASSQFE